MKKFSIADRFLSFKFAFRGIILLFKNEHNSWIHLFLSILAIGLGFYFEISKLEWIGVIVSIGIVLAAEIFNTAIEQIANFIQPNQDGKIAQIKDLAAGGVLITAITAFVVGLIIFLPKIITLLSA